MPELEAAQFVQGALELSGGTCSAEAVLLDAVADRGCASPGASDLSRCSSECSTEAGSSDQVETRIIPYASRKKLPQRVASKTEDLGGRSSEEVARELAEMAAWAERVERTEPPLRAHAPVQHAPPVASLAQGAPERGLLVVKILGAFNLNSARGGLPPRKTNPAEFFAAVRVGKHAARTEIVNGSADPIWSNSCFKFGMDLKSEWPLRTARFEVVDVAGLDGPGWMEVDLGSLGLGDGLRRRQALQTLEMDGIEGEIEVEVRLEEELPPRVLVLSDGEALCTRWFERSPGVGSQKSISSCSSRGVPSRACDVQARCWQYLERRHPDLKQHRDEHKVRLRKQTRVSFPAHLALSEDVATPRGRSFSVSSTPRATSPATKRPSLRSSRTSPQHSGSMRRQNVQSSLVTALSEGVLVGELLRRLQRSLRTTAFTKLAWRCDRDGTGKIEASELRRLVCDGLRLVPDELPEADLEALISVLDDGSGTLDLEEIMRVLQRNAGVLGPSTDELRARELLAERYGPFLQAHVAELAATPVGNALGRADAVGHPSSSMSPKP